MSPKQWDIFISYASEDRESVALPLEAHLQKAGLRVWIDEEELKVGDSLREKIDEGLANSRFGALIISPHFLQKQWPKREFNALWALDEGEQGIILPVWHQISRDQVASFSPLLADRLSVNTSKGMHSVAESIVSVVLRKRSGSPSAENPTAKRRLLNLVEGNAEPSAIADFASYHRDLFGSKRETAVGIHLGEAVVPVVTSYMGNIGDYLVLRDFAAVRGPLLSPAGGFADDIETIAARLSASLEWCFLHPSEATAAFESGISRSTIGGLGVGNPFGGIIANRISRNCIYLRIAARRRADLSDTDKKVLSETRAKQLSLQGGRLPIDYTLVIETYDSVMDDLDAANRLTLV